MAYEYFYGREADKFMFIRIPKLMFELEGIREISLDSKLMYGLLLDRVGLSAENGWVDDEGRIYIIYTMEGAAKVLGCSVRKAYGIIKELEDKGLVERKRRGMGKPNLMYVKNFLTDMQDLQNKNCRICTSRPAKSAVQDLQDLQTNNTNKNNTEMNNTDYELSLQDRQADDVEKEIYRQIITDDIGYEALISEYPYRELIDSIVELMAEVMCSGEAKIWLGKEEKSLQVVKGMFAKLKHEHIVHVIEGYIEHKKRIRDVRQYLLSALYYASIDLIKTAEY
jgi:hypothetical protein